jgi:hypothetical protein
VDALYVVRRQIRMGISESEPWDGERRWSHFQANRKEPFSGYQRGRLGQEREGETSALPFP